MAHALVRDVSNIIRIDTLRSTPLIVDRPANAKSPLDRGLSLRPELIESFPATLLPVTAHVVIFLYLRWIWCPGRSVEKRPLISAYGTRFESPAKLPWDFNV